jgi:hypothetical protein
MKAARWCCRVAQNHEESFAKGGSSGGRSAIASFGSGSGATDSLNAFGFFTSVIEVRLVLVSTVPRYCRVSDQRHAHLDGGSAARLVRVSTRGMWVL